MASHLKSVPKVVPMHAPMQSPDGWMWDGANWTCDGHPSPPPCEPEPCPPPHCPPPGWPQPCPPFYPPPAGQPPWYPGANGGVSFSATAPPCPIRGAFWYDGNILWMFDGANWVDVGLKGISTLIGQGGGAVFIGATAPPAAKPGTLWWNGTELQLWDGTKWNFIGPTQAPTPVEETGRVVALSVFGASQLITIPAGCTQAYVQMWGASGGSGGISNGSSGGTGAGGYLEKLFTGLTPGNTINFTCGQGGQGGAAGGAGNNGSPGSVTTLTSGSQAITSLTCNPSGGTAGSTGPNATVGSVGGTASGGDINLQGQTGGDGNIESNFHGAQGGSTFYAMGADGGDDNGSVPGNNGHNGGLKITWMS